KSYTIRQNLDLKKLEMEPGDELFLFVKASDNKVPHHQSARTLTYIISMADTASYKAAVSAGLPVDRMPDYFRSQRQIIIDTEALIKQRPKLKHDSFMETSNNIAVDQKLLRLRYGKFFGEEFESQEFGIAAFDPNQADQHASDATVEPQTVTDPAMAMEIIADFVHDHDANEQDAFIEASVRILMKQALSNMWDAELHLRLGKPEKALPYEYQALELIKEATKKSRIYVERVGFEAPLLKPLENRYKGELDKISSQNKKSTSQKTDPFASIRLLIQLLDIDKTVQFDQSDIELIQAASTELAAVVDENPVIVLNALKSIRIAEESRRLKSEVAQSLKLLLNELLPDDTEQKHIEKQISNELQKRYLKELQKIQ
ncbi:MAG: hypothetical protein KDD94_13875, partial [Calditrichaeota bacterium]|nr:hypothetical protein [Calditrichota bacterium]